MLELGVSYSPAGLLTPFHLGASYQLKQLQLIDLSTHYAGTSGGALAAITNRLQYDNNIILDKCVYVAEQCLYKGTRGTLRYALEEVLNEVITDDSHNIANNNIGSCTIAYKQVIPEFKNQIIDKFNDKDDLINVLLATCNIPLYFNGFDPFIKVRDSYGVDGFFAIDRDRFGCPETNSPIYDILITPFDGTKLICPYNRNKHNKPYDIISSHLLSNEDWPYDFISLIGLALNPPNSIENNFEDSNNANTDKLLTSKRNFIKSTYDQLYDCGIKAVDIWSKSDSYYNILKVIENKQNIFV